MRLIFLVLLLSTCVGCALKKSPKNGTDPTFYDPEIFNSTPFSVSHFISEAEGKYFFTAVTKVTFKNYPGGETKFDHIQEPITPQTVRDSECPIRPYTINDVVPFRFRAELFLRDRKNSPWTSLTLGKDRIKLDGPAGCKSLSQDSGLKLVPYIQDGAEVILSGAKQKIKWTIPAGFMPYVLVRYSGGEMIPTPMRLDTLFLEPSADRLVATYRTTFPIEPKVRKIDYYAVLGDDMDKPSENETVEQSLQRARITREYLLSCPVPAKPVEACSQPETKFPPLILGIR